MTGAADLQMVNITLRVLSKPNVDALPLIYKVRLLWLGSASSSEHSRLQRSWQCTWPQPVTLALRCWRPASLLLCACLTTASCSLPCLAQTSLLELSVFCLVAICCYLF